MASTAIPIVNTIPAIPGNVNVAPIVPNNEIIINKFTINEVKRELNKKYNQFQRMFLHSFKLNIPNLNVMIEAKEPEEFKKILKFDETL